MNVTFNVITPSILRHFGKITSFLATAKLDRSSCRLRSIQIVTIFRKNRLLVGPYRNAKRKSVFSPQLT